jgi:hypothetical protein
MGIKVIWNAVEAVLVQHGFVLADAQDQAHPKRAVIRVAEITGDQTVRGAISSGVVRVTFGVQVELTYEWGGDARVERDVAEDAEGLIRAIYIDVNLSNHRFVGATIERDLARNVVTDTIRFEFQSQTAG